MITTKEQKTLTINIHREVGNEYIATYGAHNGKDYKFFTIGTEGIEKEFKKMLKELTE